MQQPSSISSSPHVDKSLRDRHQPQGIDQKHVDWQNSSGMELFRVRMAHDEHLVLLLI